MKERNIYVINLDNTRLVIVGFVMVLVVGGFFLFGYRMGFDKGKRGVPTLESLGSLDSLNQNSGLKKIEGAEALAAGQKGAFPAPDPVTAGEGTEKKIDLSANNPKAVPAGLPNKYEEKDSSSGSNSGSSSSKAEKSDAENKGKTKSVAGIEYTETYYPSKKKSSTSKKSSYGPPAQQKKYTLQVAAFKKKSKAKKGLGHLKAKGFSGYIVKGKSYWLLRSGNSNNKGKLKKKISKIKAKTYFKPVLLTN